MDFVVNDPNIYVGPAARLALLGTENRRQILRLASQKPCDVSESSEYLNASPKTATNRDDNSGDSETGIEALTVKFSTLQSLDRELSTSSVGRTSLPVC